MIRLRRQISVDVQYWTQERKLCHIGRAWTLQEELSHSLQQLRSFKTKSCARAYTWGKTLKSFIFSADCHSLEFEFLDQLHSEGCCNSLLFMLPWWLRAIIQCLTRPVLWSLLSYSKRFIKLRQPACPHMNIREVADSIYKIAECHSLHVGSTNWPVHLFWVFLSISGSITK